MRFSIITVCRNSAATMQRAMDSLATQTCTDYEWIVVDGASTDGTLDIVNTFAAAPIQLVSERDNGIYDAMNKGARMARGDYVFFLNSDDCLHDPEVLADVNAAIESKQQPDMVIGRIVHVKNDGNWLRDYSYLHRGNILTESICHQAIFARRTLFQTVGEFNLRFRLNADYDWVIRVMRSDTRIAYLDRQVALFSDGGAHTQDTSRLQNEHYQVRRQYMGHLHLALRGFGRRVARRLHKMAYGQPPGVRFMHPGDASNA
jgi:glycosyltransferase involved in cell wall biosynthesis